MKKSTKSRSATIHLDRALWAEVEQLAERERRPLSQLLRNLIADAIAAQGRKPAAGSGRAAA